MTQPEDRLWQHQAEIGILKGNLNQITERLGTIEQRISAVENKMFWMWGSTMIIMIAGFATLIIDRFLS